MEKRYYYLVECDDCGKIDFILKSSYINMDKEPGYIRINRKLAESLHDGCYLDGDGCTADFRVCCTIPKRSL